MMHNALWIGFIGLFFHSISAQPGVTLNAKNVYGDEMSRKCIQWLHDSDNSLYLTEFLQTNFPHLLDSNQKQLLAERKELCKKVWLSYLSARLNKRASADEYSKWIWWMSDQQKMELTKMRENHATFTEIHDKMNEHFNELNSTMRQRLINEYKEKCNNFFATMANDMEKMSLEASYDAQNYEMLGKIIGEIANRQTGEMRRQTGKFALICKEVYQNLNSRIRRDLDHLIQKHLSWLSSDQRDEIRQMKSNGQSVDEIRSRLLDFVKVGGEESMQKTKESCYSWLQEVTTAEERAELHKLHETDHSACKIKVREYIKRLSPEKQVSVRNDLAVCEQIWYGMHEHGHHMHHHQLRMTRQTEGRRFKRHPHHTLEEYMAHHLQWLNDAQKEELRKMKADGKSKSEMRTMVMDIFNGLEGEAKREATNKLKLGCRELCSETFDAEQLDKIRALRDSGATVEEVSAKIVELASELTNETKKQMILDYMPTCKTVYKADRELKKERVEEYFKTHLQWLSEEQKDEVRKMVTEGKSKLGINDKLLEFYTKLGDSEQKAAAKQVFDGCMAILEKIAGKDKVAHLKATFDAGATIPEVKAIAEEMFKNFDDPEKKKKFNEYRALCGEVMEKVEQKNLDSLEYHLKRHLKWLSDEQKQELREMEKQDKTKAEIQQKVIEFFDGATGDAKVNAIEGLQDGCREMLQELFSKENMEELKKMRESGASVEVVKKRIQEIADKLDADKKAKFDASIVCSSQFETLFKHRRPDEERNLEHYFKSFLNWLTEDQRAKLIGMRKDGDSKAEIQEQIFSFYEQADSEHKKDIIEKLAGGCRFLIGKILGEENAKQLKQMRDDHASFEELRAKAAEMAEKITDPKKKQKMAEYKSGCEKIFKIKHGKTKDYPYSLERYLKTSLSWLTDEQKKELRDIEEAHKQSTNAKIAHFLDIADQETKAKAVKGLKGGCDQLIRKVVGGEGMETLRQMRDEGKTFDEISAKYNELIAHVTDGEQKQKAEVYKPICSLVHKYSIEAVSTKSRFKRDSQAHWFDDLEKNAKVLSSRSDGQPSENDEAKLDGPHPEQHITIQHTSAEKF